MTQNDLKGFRFRESTRAPFETEVKLRFDRFGGAVSGFSADISMEGMFVRTGEPKPVGTLVQFEFSLGQDGELIQGLGDVVWVRTRQLAPDKPPGMGIQFRYIDPHSRELIVKIVDKHLKETKQEGASREPAGTAQRESAASPRPEQKPAPLPAPSSSAPPSAIPPASPSMESGAAPAAAPAPSPPPSPQSPAPSPEVEASDPDAGGGPAVEAPHAAPASPPRPAAPDERPREPPTAGSGELFIPDEAWDPVAAAARAVQEPSLPLAEPAPRPAYSGSAGVARKSSGRRWVGPAVLLIVAVLAGAGFAFRDRLLALLPGGGGEATPSRTDPVSAAESPMVSELPAATVASPEEESRSESAPPGTEEASVTPEPQPPPSQVAEVAGSRLTRVEEIRSWQPAGETVVTIEANGTVREGDFSQLRLENPPRLLVKLFGVEEAYRPSISVGSNELRQIRTALHAGDELHVVFDLASPEVQAEVTNDSGRLRIRLER